MQGKILYFCEKYCKPRDSTHHTGRPGIRFPFFMQSALHFRLPLGIDNNPFSLALSNTMPQYVPEFNPFLQFFCQKLRTRLFARNTCLRSLVFYSFSQIQIIHPFFALDFPFFSGSSPAILRFFDFYQNLVFLGNLLFPDFRAACP